MRFFFPDKKSSLQEAGRAAADAEAGRVAVVIKIRN